ncbi:MAG: enoyl-CoA hydratase/isomerase family protein [Caulobacterales bacterium]
MTSRRPAKGASATDRLLRDLVDLEGAGMLVTELTGAAAAPISPTGAGVVRVGVHRQGPLPVEGLKPFDILLTADATAPRQWVSLPPDRIDEAVEGLKAQVARQPAAAAVAAQILRMTLKLSFDQSLALESLGYSMLLASEGFRAWRAATPARDRPAENGPRVRIDQADGRLGLRLSRPASRNAFDARMRDELTEALTFALEHPDAPAVELSGDGPAFSAGGDLEEFGRATDAGAAHLIRTLRSPARLVRQLGDRLTARVQGACVGAGIEVTAAAARLIARSDAFFRLPEVSMGLIPGAGGTASIPRRIGRRGACYMAISGADIDLDTALAWGLVDAAEPA